MGKYDPLIYTKCKNNKQRKLANIRVRNALNKMYLDIKLKGTILDFEVVGVKIVNRVQSAGIKIIHIAPAKDIEVKIGFTNDNFGKWRTDSFID